MQRVGFNVGVARTRKNITERVAHGSSSGERRREALTVGVPSYSFYIKAERGPI